MLKKILAVALLSLVCALVIAAPSPVGKWKMHILVLNKKGIRPDILKKLETIEIVCQFKSDKTLTQTEPVKKTVLKGKWTQNGATVNVDMGRGPQKFQFSKDGKTLTCIIANYYKMVMAKA